MAADLQERFGSRIRQMRTKRGFSQEEFADICEIHRTFMGSIERGERNVTLNTLHRLARGLQVPMSRLLTRLDGASDGKDSKAAATKRSHAKAARVRQGG